ncbi:hypothetical protein Gotri_000494 [Gossypium trilobum]|uniref:Uncharacterized protein n=1 Tax=Gossypium trilobum TaxID=34281 RepID=A0A7J9FBH3_9ROSI|nr:hypothetical protein [Gossypium trilobum]
MNFMASECSSGCESGWTNYLEQSFLSSNPSKKKNGFKKSGFCDEHREINRGKQKVDDDVENDDDEEEEDLSMVSDASSGPPHFYEDDNKLYDEYMVPQTGTTFNKNGGKRHRNKEQRRRQHEQQHEQQVHEEIDTASSPYINYSKKSFVDTNNQAPMGFSATHFEGGSQFEGHFGFFQSSSPSPDQLQNNQLSGFKKIEEHGVGNLRLKQWK